MAHLCPTLLCSGFGRRYTTKYYETYMRAQHWKVLQHPRYPMHKQKDIVTTQYVCSCLHLFLVGRGYTTAAAPRNPAQARSPHHSPTPAPAYPRRRALPSLGQLRRVFPRRLPPLLRPAPPSFCQLPQEDTATRRLTFAPLSCASFLLAIRCCLSAAISGCSFLIVQTCPPWQPLFAASVS